MIYIHKYIYIYIPIPSEYINSISTFIPTYRTLCIVSNWHCVQSTRSFDHMTDSARYWYDAARYWYDMSLIHQRNAHQLATRTVVPSAPTRSPVCPPPVSKKRTRATATESSLGHGHPAFDASLLSSIRSFSDIATMDVERLGLLTTPQGQRLAGLVPIAKELEAMVGMKEMKQTLFKMLVYQLQQTLTFKRRRSIADGMLHMCITGEPGTGKTSLAGLIGRLFAACGSLEKGHVVVAKRSDLVGKYVGHTAPRTLDVLTSALGGVLVIDEVYSLGSPGGTDTFAREAVDTINEFLSQHAHDILVVVAGYKEDIATNFFAQNKGLARRFPVVVDLRKPSPDDMVTIYETMASRCALQLDPAYTNKIRDFIKRHYTHFTHNAGDMETLLTHTKFETAARTWQDSNATTVTITLDDVHAGYKTMMASRCVQPESRHVAAMYT